MESPWARVESPGLPRWNPGMLSLTHCPEENSLQVSFKQTTQSIFMHWNKILPSFTFGSVAIIWKKINSKKLP